MPQVYWQLVGEEIDVATWEEDAEYPHFPEGSRDKRLLHCPTESPFPWLVGGHRYLFKQSRSIYPEQFWAEVIASRLERLTGVPVPPVYAAWDSRTRQSAALIEWFYGYPGSSPQGFLSGGLFMKAAIKDFDHKTGRQHNFTHITMMHRVLSIAYGPQTLPSEDWMQRWARMFTFDALIGNTDRHQENWGMVWTRSSDEPFPRSELTPAFDNGTSMGFELFPRKFQQWNASQIRRYIEKGHHHLRWRLGDAKPCGHRDLLLKVLEKNPEMQAEMLAVLDFPQSDLKNAIMPLVDLNVPTRLSPERARFTVELLKARREYLLAALLPGNL
jgi:hypothetical protein